MRRYRSVRLIKIHVSIYKPITLYECICVLCVVCVVFLTFFI